jgi:site-specific recombinase XerD
MNFPRLYKRSESPYWFSSWYLPDGKRQQRSLRGLNLTVDIPREEATLILYQHLGIDKPDPAIPTPEKLTLAWFRGEILRRVEREGWRKSTIREYQIALNHLLAMLDPGLLLTDVKKLHVSQLQDYLLEKENAPLTVNKVCSQLRAAFERMVDDEVLDKNPFRKFRKLSPGEFPPRHFTPEQLSVFLEEVNACGDEPLIHYIYICTALGLRRTEVLRILREDVDMVHGRVRVENVKRRNIPKRWITIPPAVNEDFQWFLSLPVLQPFAWCHPDTVTHRVKKLILRAGLPESLHLHSLRHTFATLALAQGESVVRVRDAMGHTDIKTTIGYSHTTADGGKPIDLGVDLGAHRDRTVTKTVTVKNFKEAAY